MGRIIPQSYYYSGQGRLLIGERDANGRGYNFFQVGNVTSLTADISVEKFEHKESMSGQRSIDNTIVKEKKASLKISCESLSPKNLALGLYGETSEVAAAAAIVKEPHKYVEGGIVALRYPNVTAVSVYTGDDAGTATLVDNAGGTAYLVDPEFGTIHILDPDDFTGDNVYVSYTPGAHTRLDVFTNATPPERFFRFEGLNTVNGDLVLIEMPRVALEPLTGLELINDEFGKMDMTGSILLDDKITVGSQFMIQRIIKAAA